MVVDTSAMTVFQLIDAIPPYIEGRGYSKSYVDGLKEVFNNLKKYCVEHGYSEFNAEIAQQFLCDRYKLQPGTIERRVSRQVRAMDMLSDYQHCGAVMIRRSKEKVFPEKFSVHAEAYFLYMKNRYAQPNTVESHRKTVYRFTDFVDSRGVRSYDRLTLDDVNAFIKITLCNYSTASARCYFGILRAFLRYLYKSEILSDDLSKKVISVPETQKNIHLPSTLTLEQIESILNCVDRESPMGKRDYAVLLLASRLGLRVSDIRNLKESDINWETKELRITQAKTKEPLILPLPLDVGWAIIDYCKNARPKSEAPELFLRVVAPHTSLKNPDNILIRYMREAKIPYERLSHHGLHILRHSLATHLLDEEVDITTIQGILGHLNIETTNKYIGINVRQLKECALEVASL